MKDELSAAAAASLQDVAMAPDRSAAAAAVARAIGDRIAAAALLRLSIDDHPADFTTLQLKSLPPASSIS